MERRKFVIGMGSLAAGAAAATGTGAFTAAELSGREADIEVANDADGLVGLEAGDTEFVSNSGGELTIDLSNDDKGGEGLNPNSTYQVGGLGGFDTNNLNLVPGDETTDPSVGDVAIDTETDITGEHAFKVMNQTGGPKDIEIAYNANEEPFPDGTRLFLVAYYPEGSDVSEQEEGLAVGDYTNKNEKAASIIFDDDQDYSASIGSGDEFYVTILVEVGEFEEDGDDLGGDMTVRAGSHDGFTNADD